MTMNVWRRDHRPLSIAHRGHSIEFPENTLQAYHKAIELGVEVIECDVNISRDRKLVMIHDPYLDRTTSGTGRVSDYSWEELRNLSAGSWFNLEFEAVKIPSTEETLELFLEAKKLVCFEVKGADPNEANRVAQSLVDLLVNHEALNYVFLNSYYHQALALAKTLAPEIRLVPECLTDKSPPDPKDALRQAQGLGGVAIQHNYRLLSPDILRVLHQHDIAIWVWTPNDEESIRGCIEFGVDGILSDNVRLLMEVLEEYQPD